MRFIAAGYYDLSSLYTSYIGKHKKGLVESAAPSRHKVRVLELLSDGEETEALKNWNSAKALFHKVGERLKALPAPAEVTKAYILAFAPGSYSQWAEGAAGEESGTLYGLLNPSPNFRLYSGEETIAPLPWCAYAVDSTMVSASNFNAPNTAHVLVLETAAHAD